MSESESESETRPADAAAHLERARERLADVEARIDDRSAATVERTAEAYRSVTALLDEYVDRATGTGRENFKAYVELEGRFDALVESLPDDLPRRDAFEAALDALDRRRLSEADFERARDALDPASTFADLVDERETAREALAAARTDAGRRRREVDDEIDGRERLLDLADADLDAPVERLREPIATYDAAIREAFEAYRREASAREVFDLLDRSRWYPFVPFERPPDDLRTYVETNPAGEYAVPDLLEYADYSRSKLDHYVDDADELKRHVATRRTYLTDVDAGPLTVGWPPESAAVLRRRTRELTPFVARVADADCVATLREVRALTRDDEYDRLRTAAVARDRLTPDERERLADGRVADELAALRSERDRLDEALAVEDPV